MKKRSISRSMLAILSIILSTQVVAEPNNAQQNPLAVREAAENFLKTQSAGQSGDVRISVGSLDSRLNLAACPNLLPFLPQGSKPWGKITVGVRCAEPTPWIVYLTANVQITGDYYVTAGSLAIGHVLTSSDLTKTKGELSSLPNGVVTNPEQAIGRSITTSVTSGTTLRGDILKNPPVVQQGQSVRVTSTGKGFQVATDGQALNNASEGQVAKAKTMSGQVVSGIARAGGVIEVTY